MSEIPANETPLSPLRLTVPTEHPSHRERLGRLVPELGMVLPGFLAVGLMLVWAVHDGGFDEDTWYWGALAMLALTTGSWVALGRLRRPLSRPAVIAITLFAAYVGWSYLSMTWARDAGTAWEGSNRALLYLLTFVLMSILPWRRRAVMAALVVFAVGIGATAAVLLVRVAEGDRLGVLIAGGRLAAPTGYFNATAALFTMGALVGIGLASRGELRGLLGGLLRGFLLGLATADLCMAITVQSRGWLFTLPLVAVVSIILCRDRLALTAAAALPVIGAALDTRRLIDDVGEPSTARALNHLAPMAGRPALLICVAVFVIGTAIIWLTLRRPLALSQRVRRAIGVVLVGVAVLGSAAVLQVVSSGHPGSYVSREWHGFAHESPATATSSHFEVAGSGRYDFWRVGLDAFEAHPIGGLGQDNFLDYYMLHRHTTEEPTYVHSLELRLLVHTGIIGFLLFLGFAVFAIAAALRGRRRADPMAAALIAIALLPFVDWVIHGSIDWFWEMPALSGPALGFLGMSTALASEGQAPVGAIVSRPVRNRRRILGYTLGTAAALAAMGTLAFPYLSVREVSIGSNIQNIDPDQSLADLKTAAQLNPLDETPDLTRAAVALRNDRWGIAASSIRGATERDPGDWVAWFLSGLAASEQGRGAVARADYERAIHINGGQPIMRRALAALDTTHPVSPREGLAGITSYDS